MAQENSKESNNIRFVRVKGNCMEPCLKEDSLAPFVPVSFSSLKKGDIAVLKLNDELLIHRVIDKFEFHNRSFLVHKGDISPLPLVITSEGLMGKVILENFNCAFRQNAILKLNILLIRIKLIVKILMHDARDKTCNRRGSIQPEL